MAGARRTVRVGSISYVDVHGARRRADAGAVVDIHADDVARFDRFNRVLGDAEPPEDGGAAPAGGSDHAGAAALLDARAAALSAAEVKLADDVAALDAREAALDDRATDLDAREAALDEKVAESKKPAARSSAKSKPAADDGE